MKKIILLAVCLLASVGRAETLNVLWIGNSLTFFNKLPDLVTLLSGKSFHSMNTI